MDEEEFEPFIIETIIYEIVCNCGNTTDEQPSEYEAVIDAENQGCRVINDEVYCSNCIG